MYPCEFNKNSSIVSQDRVQTNRFWSKFDILMSHVTLDIRSRSPKTNPFIPLFHLIPMMCPHEYDKNPFIGSRDRVHSSIFSPNLTF